MKYIAILFLYLVASDAFSQATEQDCITFGDSYYTSDVESKIPLACEGLFKSSTNIKSIVETESQDLRIHGYKNILFATIYDPTTIPTSYKNHIIAGEKALLTEIEAIEINEEDQQVLVLQSSNQSITTYKLDIGGKIYPHKKLIVDDLSSATNLALDTDNQEIIAIHSTSSKLTFYRKEACIDGRIPEFSTSLLRTISGDKTQLIAPIDACVSKTQKKLFVYEENAQKVYVFSSNASGNYAPEKELEPILTAGQSIKKIDCHESVQKIILTDQNGTTISLNY